MATKKLEVMKVNDGKMMVTFSEVKGKPAQNYEMYTNTIKALEEIGRVATLKIVEAIARVNVTNLWRLGNSPKTALPYGSINEWAITEFGYSKSHVSEMLSVAKQCCDPETGAPLESLAGYSYSQLLALTKNPKLLLKLKAGEEVEGIGLASTKKEILAYGAEKPAIEDKQEGAENGKEEQEQADSTKGDDADNGKGESKTTETPHKNRTLTIEMTTFEEWYNKLSVASEAGGADLENSVVELLNEWDKICGNPFAEGK